GTRLEPQARAGAAAAAALLGAARGADDDFLAFLEVAPEDLGRRAVADAEREAHGLQLLTVHDVDTAGRAGAPATLGAALARAHLVVFRALLGREHLADAAARRLTESRALGLALLLGERLHLLARVGEDRVELLLLRRGEVERLGEPLLHLLARGPAAAATLARALTLAAARSRGRGGAGRRVGAGRPEAQRGVGHLEHAGLFRGDHLDVRGHPRQQAAAGIVDRDHDGVGDDVLDDLGRLADLRHAAHERLAGEGVHREGRPILEPHAPDVGLVHADLDLHLGEVLGDREQHRRLQRGGHRLADVDLARDDHAVDRRADRRVLEVGRRLGETGLLLVDLGARGLQLGFDHAQLRRRRLDTRVERLLPGARRLQQRHGRIVGGLRGVEVALGDELALEELGLAFEVALGVQHA